MGTPVEDLRRSEEKHKNHLLFYGRRHAQKYQILKLDLNRDFSAVETVAWPKISLKRRSHQQVSSPLSRRRRKRRSWNWVSSMVGRCNRHLRLRYKFRQLEYRIDRMDTHVIPFPKPFFEIRCTARKGGFPEEFAMGAVGSKLYLFGGYSWTGKDPVLRYGMVLPRDVYYIDATTDSAEPVKMSCQMNSGKRSPLAWTVGGKIYVLPDTFILGEDPGECFDPKSESWTVLPSPPFVDDKSQFTIPWYCFGQGPPLLLVKNNILFGSNLVVSTHDRKHYGFDTAQPSLGWRAVSLRFGSNELEFLPFDPLSSVPVGDSLMYCYVDSQSFPGPDFRCVNSSFSAGRDRYREPHIGPGGHAEKSFLKSLDIGDGDSYVCHFEYDGGLLHLSIKPVRGIGGLMKWGEYVSYVDPQVAVVGMGGGLVMYVKSGYDRFYMRMRCSFNLLRIQEEEDRYVASNISSALLIPGVISHFSSFVMKDGTFT